MAELDNKAASCNYTGYVDKYVTYPPKGLLPLPGKSIVADEGCDLWDEIFNAALMLLMNLISLSLFILLLGYPLAHPLLFVGISCFGACSISLLFSFLAAIAARAQQNAALMAILGFPLIIPQLLLLMRLSGLAFSDVFQSGLISIILLLAAFDVMIIVLSVILFPFLWKD